MSDVDGHCMLTSFDYLTSLCFKMYGLQYFFIHCVFVRHQSHCMIVCTHYCVNGHDCPCYMEEEIRITASAQNLDLHTSRCSSQVSVSSARSLCRQLLIIHATLSYAVQSVTVRLTVFNQWCDSISSKVNICSFSVCNCRLLFLVKHYSEVWKVYIYVHVPSLSGNTWQVD